MFLDATVGTSTANSYVTEAEADEYFINRSNATSWEMSTQKEALLITASRLIDWQLQFKGAKTFESQSMKFPRTGIIMSDGETIPSDIIPVEIKYAVFELALLSMESDRVSDDPLAGLKEVKAGPLTVKTATPNENPKNPTIPEFIKTLLSGFLASRNVGVYRLIRA